MNRQESNKEILKRLLQIVKEHPDLRLGQILESLNLNHIPFYEEPSMTLANANWMLFGLDIDMGDLT